MQFMLDEQSPGNCFFEFEPSYNRAQLVESRVRKRLADSLEAVLQALAAEPLPSFGNLIARIREGPVAPAVFGIYTEIVESIFFDDIERAVELTRELCGLDLGGIGSLRVVNLDDGDLRDMQSARYRRLIDDDP